MTTTVLNNVIARLFLPVIARGEAPKQSRGRCNEIATSRQVGAQYDKKERARNYINLD
ncbi:MAG: hypothetical protein WBE46_06205 [Dehalococcoidia bacterium]